jgi:putative Mg2+ transporter-C (MgtC) family protein
MLLASSIPSLSWEEVLLRVVVAALLGGAIGVERELRERGAGLRTHLLVCVGSALFTIVSAYGFRDFLVSGGNVVRADPTRIAAQIVSGIGFLGAGAIIRQGFSVRGLTTAATLWVVAAIGITSGAGYYSAAVITTIVAIVSLWPLRIAARWGLRRFQAEHGRLLVQIASGQSPGPLMTEVERLGARIESVEIGQEGDRRNIGLGLALPNDAEIPDLVAKVSDVEHVLEVRWSEE